MMKLRPSVRALLWLAALPAVFLGGYGWGRRVERCRELARRDSRRLISAEDDALRWLASAERAAAPDC